MSDSLQKHAGGAGQASAFDALEAEFRSVLEELVGDKTLERFRIEYEKLHNTLKKSHENEKKLIKKCRQLNGEIVANAAKIQTALRLSLQDQNSITLLKKEIDKAWSMVDSAQEKEKKARENVQRLKKQIANLTRLVDQGAGLSIGKENTVNDLLRAKVSVCMYVSECVSYDSSIYSHSRYTLIYTHTHTRRKRCLRK
jgi:chromosome segregation ATPase